MNRIPRWPFRLLSIFCPAELFEEISGDLEQRFERDVRNRGLSTAKRRLIWSVFRFFRPGILFRNRISTRLNQQTMIRHFLKIFGRVVIKEKSYSLINISGLAIGLAASSIILLWIVDEFNYDSINKNKDRIYRIVGHHNFPDGFQTSDDTPGPLIPAMVELPEVEAACRVIDFGDRLVFNAGDKSFYEKGVYAEPSIVDVLTIPVIHGNGRLSPDAKDEVMISQKLAEKYFGNENAIGKTLRVNGERELRVTTVFEDVPSNSTIQFDYILPYAIYVEQDQYNNEWGAWTGGTGLVKLYNNEDRQKIESKIHEAYTKPNIWVRWDNNVTLGLFAMNDWRLRGDFKDGIQSGGRIRYVTALGIVAGFILFIACANFVNLATARSIGRSREVGVRKVIGAVRMSLVRQFMIESILTAFIAAGIGLIIVHLSLPYFNEITSKQLTIDYSDPTVIGTMISIVLITGIIAGSYPSLFLSSVSAISALRGNAMNLTGAGVRKSLVVVQFALSSLMIAAALTIFQQIEYMRSKDLGFDREHVFSVEYYNELNEHFDAYRTAAMSVSAIENVARGSSSPMPIFGGMVLGDNAWRGKTENEDIRFQYLRCDDQYLSVIGLKMLAGKGFSKTNPDEGEPEYIVNEEAARWMKLEDPVGVSLAAPKKGTIVGLVKNFHSSGLREKVQPLIIAHKPSQNGVILVRYREGNLAEAVTVIGNLHRQYSPNRPVEMTFMDDEFNELYKEEILTGKLAGSFTMIAIVISCMGLFGLISFSAERRRKEIGIRKVLGAEVRDVVVLLCGDFVVLIGIALVIGLPLAWWFANNFLSDYAFHVNIGAWFFLLTIGGTLALAIAAVSVQAISAAVSKPVDTLRSE